MMYNAQKVKSGLKKWETCEFCGEPKQPMEIFKTEHGTKIYKPLLIPEQQRERVKHANFCKKNPDRQMELIPYIAGTGFFQRDPNFQSKISKQIGMQTQSKARKREKKSPTGTGTFADTILQARDSSIPVAEKVTPNKVINDVPIANVIQPSFAVPIACKDNGTQTPLSFSDVAQTTDVDNNGSPLRKRRLFMDQSPVTTRENAELSPFTSPSPLKRPFAMGLGFAQSPGELLSRLPSTMGDEGEVLEEFYTTKPNIDNSQT